MLWKARYLNWNDAHFKVTKLVRIFLKKMLYNILNGNMFLLCHNLNIGLQHLKYSSAHSSLGGFLTEKTDKLNSASAAGLCDE